MYYLLISPLVVLGLRTLLNVYSSTLLDFSMYLTATHYFLSGYNPYLAITPQVYPPAFLYMMIPFALIPIHVARLLWTTLSLFSLFFSIHLLLKKQSLKLKIFLGLVILQLFPVKFALAQGQINIFVFLGFVLIYHFYIHKKDFLAGFTLALIIIMKLNPLLLTLYFLILKKYRLLCYCFATLLILNFAIDLSSVHHLTSFFVDATLIRSNNPPLGYYNQSLPALLGRFNLSFISNLIGITLLFFSSFSFFKNPTHTYKYFVLFLLTILLISPITWQHYLFWSLPAFIYILRDSQKKYLLLTTVSFILINLNLKNPTPFEHWPIIFSHATIGLLILYFLVLKSLPKTNKIS